METHAPSIHDHIDNLTNEKIVAARQQRGEEGMHVANTHGAMRFH